MTDVRTAWDEAGEALSGLALRLKLHYEQQRGGDDAEAAVESAVAKLGVAIQDAFDALGAAATDDAVRSDVAQVGKSLTEALSVTFAEMSEPVRKAFDRKD